MRCFVALELPDEFADDVAALARVLERHIDGRFMPRDNYHLTLAFLGDVGEDGAARAIRALDEACRGRGPVPLVADGLGRFGRGNDATLWLGIRQTDAVMSLAADVRSALLDEGVTFDETAFKAHITLARRARLPREPLPNLPFPADAEATRVTLFRSFLDAQGATYKPLYTTELV